MGCGKTDRVQARSNVVPLFDIRNVRWRRYKDGFGCKISSGDSFQLSLARAESRHLISACTSDNDIRGEVSGEDSTAASKSLWIFWFGDEPLLKDVVSEELREAEVGCWERGVGNRCMQVLFEALKTYAERSLIVQGDLRLGKYIVSGLQERGDGNPLILLSLHVFLLGGHFLSVSIDVLQACTPLEPITSASLLAAGSSSTGVPVLLSPSGVPARLHGSSGLSDRRNCKCLETWKLFYPVPACAPDVPNVVDVTIGDVHMIYPTSLVLVTVARQGEDAVATVPASASVLAQRPAITACSVYKFGMQHAAAGQPLDTVDRLANRLHSGLVYSGSTERRCHEDSQSRRTAAASLSPAEPFKRPASSQAFASRIDKRKRHRSSAVLATAIATTRMASVEQPEQSASATSRAQASNVSSMFPSRPASRLSCRYSSANSIPSPFLAANPKEAETAVASDKPPAAALRSPAPRAATPAPGPMMSAGSATSDSAVQLPSLLSLADVRRRQDTTMATSGSPTANVQTAVERKPCDSPLATPSPAAARALDSMSSTAKQLLELYKLPSAQDDAVGLLAPWFVNVSGTQDKVAVPSILTCTARHNVSRGMAAMSSCPPSTAPTTAAMYQLASDQVLTPPSVEDRGAGGVGGVTTSQPWSSHSTVHSDVMATSTAGRNAVAGSSTLATSTALPHTAVSASATGRSGSSGIARKQDYTQIESITISGGDFDTMFSSDGEDSDADDMFGDAERLITFQSPGKAHEDRPNHLLGAMPTPDVNTQAITMAAGPSLVEDCELGRMYPTPPSTSTADGAASLHTLPAHAASCPPPQQQQQAVGGNVAYGMSSVGHVASASSYPTTSVHGASAASVQSSNPEQMAIDSLTSPSTCNTHESWESTHGWESEDSVDVKMYASVSLPSQTSQDSAASAATANTSPLATTRYYVYHANMGQHASVQQARQLPASMRSHMSPLPLDTAATGADSRSAPVSSVLSASGSSTMLALAGRGTAACGASAGVATGILSPSQTLSTYTPLYNTAVVSSNHSSVAPSPVTYSDGMTAVDSVDFLLLLEDSCSSGQAVAERPSPTPWTLAWWQVATRPASVFAKPRPPADVETGAVEVPHSNLHMQSLVAVSDEVLRLKRLRPHTLPLSAVDRALIVDVIRTCWQRSSPAGHVDEARLASMLSQYQVLPVQVLTASHCQLSQAVQHVNQSLSAAISVLQSTMSLPGSIANLASKPAATARRRPMAWHELKLCLPGSSLDYYQLGIPAFLVGVDNDLVSSSPFVLPYWEKLSLQTVSQPCHLHYAAFVLDSSNVDYSLCRTFFKDIGYVFKDCQFGVHNPLPRSSATDAVVIVDSSNIRKRLSEVLESINAVLPMLATEPIDTLDYQCMTGPRHSHRFVLYLVVPNKKMSAPPTLAGAGHSAGRDGDSEGCLAAVLEWVQQLEPTFRRSAVQVQVVLDSQLADGIDVCSRPCQLVAKMDTRNCAVWCDGSKELAATVYQQALESLVDATRFPALTDFATSTERHRLLRSQYLNKQPQRHMKSSPFLLAPSRLATLCNATASPAQSSSGQLPATATAAAALQRSTTPTPGKPSLTHALKTQPSSDVSSSAGSSAAAAAALGASVSLLYCSYAWVDNVLCACLMDSSGQQQHTLTLEAASRSTPLDSAVLKATFQELFNMALKFIGHSLLPWKLVVCHIGPIDALHLSVWQDVLSRESIAVAFEQKVRSKCGACHRLPAALQPSLVAATLVSLSIPVMQLSILKDCDVDDEEYQLQCPASGVSVSGTSTAAAGGNTAAADANTAASISNAAGNNYPWAELCVGNTHSAERVASPPSLQSLSAAPSSSVFSPTSSLLDPMTRGPGDVAAGNPLADMMPSPNSPGLMEGMLAAFGSTSPSSACRNRVAANFTSLATPGDGGYHPVSTLHIDDTSSSSSTVAGSAATAVGNATTATAASSVHSVLYEAPGEGATSAGSAGSDVSASIAAMQHPPLAMAWLATNVDMDDTSALYLNYSKLTGAGNATLIQSSLHIHNQLQGDQHQSMPSSSSAAMSSAATSTAAVSAVSTSCPPYTRVLRRIMEDFYSQCWLSCSWARAEPSTCLPPHISNVTRLCLALASPDIKV